MKLKVTDYLVHHAMDNLLHGREVTLEGWTITFNWADGYRASNGDENIDDFDNLTNLLTKLKERIKNVDSSNS
jgi:hypothetical protein